MGSQLRKQSRDMTDSERHAEMLKNLPPFEVGDFVSSTSRVRDFYAPHGAVFDIGIVCRVKCCIYMLRDWYFKDTDGRTFQSRKFARCVNQDDPKPWYKHDRDPAPFDVGDEVTPICSQTRGYCHPRDNTVYREPGTVVTVVHTAVDVLTGSFIFADEDGFVYRCGDFVRALKPPAPFASGDRIQVKTEHEATGRNYDLAETGVFTVLACVPSAGNALHSKYVVSLESHGKDLYFEADMFEGVS